MMKRLEYEKRLRELGLFCLGQRRLSGISPVYGNVSREGAKTTEPGSLQQCPVAGSEEKGTHRRLCLKIKQVAWLEQGSRARSLPEVSSKLNYSGTVEK